MLTTETINKYLDCIDETSEFTSLDELAYILENIDNPDEIVRGVNETVDEIEYQEKREYIDKLLNKFTDRYNVPFLETIKIADELFNLATKYESQ